MEFIWYIFKVSICMSVFYAFYRVALFKLSFYQWNRFFLIGTTLLSLVIPLIVMPLFSSESVVLTQETPPFLQNLQGNIGNYQAQVAEIDTSFPISFILICVYAIILIYLLLKFSLDIFQVVRIIWKSEKIRKGKYTLVKTDDLPISSFFNYIFLGNNDLGEKELAQIIFHECVHIREKHSFDVLFFRLLSIFCWFNPIVLWVQKSVLELHEYIADGKAVRTSSPAEYARLLFKLSVGTVQCSALNTFSTTLIKSRIMKLNQNQTDRSQKVRFVFAMPLVAMLVVLFSYLNPVVAQSEKLLVGNWRGVDMQMKFNEGAKVTQDAYDDMAILIKTLTYSFKNDGTFQQKSTHRTGFDEAGTWKISVDKKFIECEENGKKTQLEIVELSDKKLIIKKIVNAQGAFTRGEFVATYTRE